MKTNKQANFLLPVDILRDLKTQVAARQQSQFVAEALRKELKRLQLEKALVGSFGAWQDTEHPELKQGVDRFVRQARKSSRGSRA